MDSTWNKKYVIPRSGSIPEDDIEPRWLDLNRRFATSDCGALAMNYCPYHSFLNGERS